MNIEKEVGRRLHELAKFMGNPIAIPPITAELVRDRRKTLISLDDLHERWGLTHTGWTEYVAPANLVGVSDPITLHALHKELAQIYDTPISIVAGLEYVIRHEPAYFDVFVKGMYPLMHEGKGTPSLYRIAHECAALGYWDAEELLMLPPPLLAIPMEMMEQIDTSSHTDEEYDMKMVD